MGVTLEERALARLPELLARWLPEGEQRGAYWMTQQRPDDSGPYGSLVVWMRSGSWKHYMGDASGADAVSLYAFLRGLSPEMAATGVEAELEALPAARPPLDGSA